LTSHQKSNPFPYSQIVVCLSIPSEASLSVSWHTLFYAVRLSFSCPTPNLEDQGIPFCLGHHLWPVWHGRPCQ
jgi:hypothetical protein